MSAAVMPMRSVPCARAGIAERAMKPRLAAATRRCFNMAVPLFRAGHASAKPRRRGMSIAWALVGEEHMSLPKAPPTLEEFRARAALSGLNLTAEDIEHLHKGYLGLFA